MRKALVMITLVVCILMFGTAYVALGAKPPKSTVSDGYIMLRDLEGDMIRSDSKGAYIDKFWGGEDRVEITNYTDGSWSTLSFMGEFEDGGSTRRAGILIDFLDDAIETPGSGTAVFDILVWTDKSKTTRRGLANNGKYYLDINTLHVPITVKSDGSLVVQFAVDPGCDGTSLDGITQTTVDAFYPDDRNLLYRTNGFGHVVYWMYFDSSYTGSSTDGTGTFEAPSGAIKLYAVSQTNKAIGRSVYLAKYPSLSFGFTVGKGLPPSQAPKKYDSSATFWGKVRSE